MEDTFTLDEILENEEIILFDNSITNLQSFSKEHAGQALGFGLDKLQEDCDLVTAVINFIEDKANEKERKVYTIKQVLSEQKKGKDMVDYALKKINSKRAFAKKSHAKYKIMSEQEYELLSNLAMMVNKLVRTSKRVVYRPSQQEPYDLLVGLMKQFGKYLKRKKGIKAYTKQKRLVISKRRDIKTDEILLATAYYISLFDYKSPAIITQDTDFTRVLPVVHRLFTALDLENRDALNNMQDKPIKLIMPYYDSQDKYSCPFKTTDVLPYNMFSVRRLSADSSDNVKRHVEHVLGELKTLAQEEVTHTCN